MSISAITFFYLIFNYAVFGKEQRIIGGENAEISESPHMVSLRHLIYNIHICGGSIISQRHVITAAHCVHKREDHYDYLRVQMGSTGSRGDMTKMWEIERIFIHPRYTGKMYRGIMNVHDIAILKLKYGITFNEFQQKLDLPIRNVNPGDSGTISGWGVLSYPADMFSERLKQASMTIINPNECKDRISMHIYDSQFCAYNSEGIGPCSGDSGGPMSRNGRIIGIISLSIPCALGLPDVYTNVFSYLDFITYVMQL